MDTIYYGNIYVIPTFIHVCNETIYKIKNVTGYQSCFQGIINLKNRIDHSVILGNDFPISLFNGKKEGDLVNLQYDYIDYDFLTGQNKHFKFTMLVTCKQLDSHLARLGTFEQALYDRSYRIDYYCNINYNKNLQDIIAYRTHDEYAKSINKDIKLKLNMKTLMLIDYISIDNQDVLNLIKPLYFVTQYKTLLTIS